MQNLSQPFPKPAHTSDAKEQENQQTAIYGKKAFCTFISDFIKNQHLVHFLPCPPACKIFFTFRHCVDDAHQSKNSHKIDQKIHFLQISHLSSNRRVCNLTLYFKFTTPARKLTHRTKFKYPGRHEFQTHHVSSLP